MSVSLTKYVLRVTYFVLNNAEREKGRTVYFLLEEDSIGAAF